MSEQPIEFRDVALDIPCHTCKGRKGHFISGDDGKSLWPVSCRTCQGRGFLLTSEGLELSRFLVRHFRLTPTQTELIFP